MEEIVRPILPIFKIILVSKLEETIKNKGGDVKSSVSSKTTLVIYSGKTSSKVEKAKELNIPVVIREKFSL